MDKNEQFQINVTYKVKTHDSGRRTASVTASPANQSTVWAIAVQCGAPARNAMLDINKCTVGQQDGIWSISWDKR